MNKFTHVNATTIADAAATLAKGKAQVIAGGTDLTSYLKGMISPNPPETVVNIKTISGLDYIQPDSSVLKIGALTTLAKIAANSTIQSNYAVLAQAALAVGSPELRNMGTIGGNICQKPRCIYYRNEFNDFNCLRKMGTQCFALTGVNRYHSIFGGVNACFAVCPSDTAIALVALNAKIITNKNSAGWDAAEFFGMPNATDARREQINNLAADEIVTEIQVPAPAAGTKSAYRKFSFRKAIDFPLVSAAVVATISGGNVSSASIVLGGVYNSPRVATQAQTSIAGKAINDANATAAGEAAITGSSGIGQNDYKRQIAKVLVTRALTDCA
ncbi:MAG: FAD binding domain-containing protein [Dehalococcoidia bacterium]|nr:FAD binding domain-containing protein [Dehalococcoidia bacterium]MCL2150062.1 FAD binding domain-containing protein [Dehalococcoidia bacterium]